jgi:hypothetical protein
VIRGIDRAELRRRYEGIDALLQGALEKAQQLPSVDQLDDLAQQVAFISGHLDNITQQSAAVLKGPHAEAGGAASDVECVIVQAAGPRH